MSVHAPVLNRRSNEVKSTDVVRYIDELKSFIGHNVLAKAQSNLDKDLTHHGRCYELWMQQRQPWLFALRLFDCIVLKGARIQPTWPEPIQRLVGNAFMISSLAGCMTEAVKAKYRKDLLTSQHNDFLFEIATAWHYHLQGYDIEWYELGHSKSAEFRVRGGGLDFDVECHRFNQDVRSRVKLAALADTCDFLYDVLLARKLWGDLTVEFSDDFQIESNQTHLRKQVLLCALDNAQTTLQLDHSLFLKLNLNPSPSPMFNRQELAQLARHPNGITFLMSQVQGELCLDPVVFHCRGPQKTLENLRDYVYKTLKTKVTTQLSRTRPGVLVVKFGGVQNPQVFNESKGMQGVIDKLFKNEYLAAVALHCEDLAVQESETIVHSAPAIVFRNPTCKFQNIAVVRHLT